MNAPPSSVVPHPGTSQWLASAGFFLITLDILIVNLALSRMGEDLGAGTSGRQWVLDGYTLLFAALLLFAGNLSDRIGAKRTFGTGIVLFGISSVLCAVAPGIGILVAARCLQGAAAALMLPASMALIREAYPDSAQRAHALGVWAAGGAVAAATGPLLGGLLTTITWRLVFAINIPVCVLMLVVLPRIGSSPHRRVPFDWVGQILSLVALSALIYALIEGGAIGFGEPLVIGAFVVAAIALAGFVALQARGAHPMMPLSLFGPLNVRIALLGGFAFFVSWYGTVFVASLYLQQELGLSPVLAGLAFVPSALVSLAGNLGSANLSNRFGSRFPALLGLSSMTLGLIAMILVVPLDSGWLVALVIPLVGAGGAVATPPLTGLVLSSTPERQAGIASAVFNTFRQVGGAIAIAVFGILVSGTAGFEAGMRISFAVAATIGLLAVLACLAIQHPSGEKP